MDYLLLRSNKESGPYTFEQLVQLGLKPYDLVWVKGKSAAWRYPSEVEELKNYAPAVEEQPYDRFYKKPGEEKHYFEKVAEQQPKNNHVTMQVKPADERTYIKPVEHFKETGNKVELTKPSEEISQSQNYFKEEPAHGESVQPIIPEEIKKPAGKVFVSMPANSDGTFQKDTIPVKATLPSYEKPVEIPVERPVVKKPTEQKIFIDDKADLKEEYSQSLDDIKKMYAETYLQRIQKTSRKHTLARLFQLTGIAASVAGLAAFVYFVILPEKKTSQPSGQPILTQEQTGNRQEENNMNDPSAAEINSTEKNPGENNGFYENEISSSASTVKNEPAQSKKQAEKIIIDDPEYSTEDPELPENIPSPGSETDPVTGQRKKTQRSSTDENVTVRSNSVINNFVSVKANAYKRKAFGGIQDLQLTVYNNSKFILDRVIVELQYLKPSEQPLKTETIEFNAVAPNGTMTIKIPDSQRGIKVEYKILEVESSQFDKHLAGM